MEKLGFHVAQFVFHHVQPAQGRGHVGGDGSLSLFFLLAQELQAHLGLHIGAFGFGKCLAALSAAAQFGVGGGNVKGFRGEAADLQQNGLLVGGEACVEALRGGRFGSSVSLSGVPCFQKDQIFFRHSGNGLFVRGAKALLQGGGLGRDFLVLIDQAGDTCAHGNDTSS